VFGMGTGVTPPVWSPEMYPAGGQARPGTGFPIVGRTTSHIPCLPNEWLLLHDSLSNEPYGMARQSVDGLFRLAFPFCLFTFAFGHWGCKGMAAPRSGWSSCLAVRTGRLKRSRAVHARPIDLVVFQEPTHFCWKPHLGGGFALRCLQRLSCPDLATRRCPERDSRHTRGRSSPILSY
jgi:hypothetical protein